MDSRTLTYALVAVSAAASLVVGAMALHTRRPAHRIYAGGFLLATIGLLLLSGQGRSSPWLGVILANLLAATWPFSLAWGQRRANGELRAFPRRFLLWLAAWLAALLAGTFLADSYPVRALSNSLLNILLAGEFLRSFLRGGEGRRRELRPAVLALCGAFMAFHAARGLLVLLSPVPLHGLMGGGAPVAFHLLGYIFFVTAWSGAILALEEASVLDELERANLALRELAMTDELTGLPNRQRLHLRLREERVRSLRYGDPLSLVMLDLDHFKRVNDTWGHDAGDAVLTRATAVARELIRGPDDLFRWGGEEFLVVAPHTDLPGAAALAEKLRAAIDAADFPAVGHLTASFGVATWAQGEEEEDWFRRVDRALYRAKNGGRNRVEAFDPAEPPPLAAVRLAWRPAWESGDGRIDGDHRALIELANGLLDLSLDGADPSRVLPAVDRLLSHVTGHFSREEAILAELAYPGREEHAAIHRGLVTEALALRERFLAGEAGTVAFFDFLVGKVVIGHLEGKDAEFFPWTRGGGAATPRGASPLP